MAKRSEAPIQLVLDTKDKGKVKVDALTISFDQFGLVYRRVETPYDESISYEELHGWEAKGRITDAQVDSAKKMKGFSEPLKINNK